MPSYPAPSDDMERKLEHDADLTATERKCLCGRVFNSRTELFRHVDRANGHTHFPEDNE